MHTRLFLKYGGVKYATRRSHCQFVAVLSRSSILLKKCAVFGPEPRLAALDVGGSISQVVSVAVIPIFF